jgi:c-di-GMP phosphodiesterase Gmr
MDVSEIAPLPMRALQALFDPERDDDPHASIFQSIGGIVPFDQAVVLEDADERWQCAAAFPRELADVRWSRGPFFDEIAAGAVSGKCSSAGLQEWREIPRHLLAPQQPALYLPIAVHGRRGLLILLRSVGKQAFTDSEVAFARQLALIALAAFAARGALRLESELASLRTQIARHQEIESDLARRAYTDELTGLPNRAMIEERVEDVLRAGGAGGFALAFIDLDNFKHINDYYNHAVGDALLVKVARRIADLVRETDMLARISGDEFLLLVHPVGGDEHILSVVEDLLERLKQPFHIEGFEMFTSASIGVSIYPDHGRSYEELRRNADNAMYRAKSGAKGAAAFFDLALGKSMSARMEMEQRLRLAIRDRQFCCAFQLKVDIRTQEVVGFETLVRWRDAQGEIHSPLAFIGLATELGLIDPITLFVLEEAIRSIDMLDEAFGLGKAIAINIAAKQAGDVRFMRSFVHALEASGCAERFIVELTEDAFIAKSQFQTEVLPMLRKLGIRVSIDDFGTGYSSLSVLADITADEIKIDRSFISNIHQRPRSQSVLKAMESVSIALGMSVVAEGVESFEELTYLLGATRIRYAQGYHFATPFFLEEIVKTNGARGDERAAAVERRQPESRPAAAARAGAGRRGRAQ